MTPKQCLVFHLISQFTTDVCHVSSKQNTSADVFLLLNINTLDTTTSFNFNRIAKAQQGIRNFGISEPAPHHSNCRGYCCLGWETQPQCTNTFIILHSMPSWGLGISTTKESIVLRKQLETWQKLFFIKLTSFQACHYVLTVSEFSFVLVLNTISERAHSKATSPHVHQARTQWWSLHSNYESPPWYQHKMSILLQREPTLARRMVGNSRRVLYFRSHWMFEPQEPRPESLTIPPIKLKRN